MLCSVLFRMANLDASMLLHRLAYDLSYEVVGDVPSGDLWAALRYEVCCHIMGFQTKKVQAHRYLLNGVLRQSARNTIDHRCDARMRMDGRKADDRRNVVLWPKVFIVR